MIELTGDAVKQRAVLLLDRIAAVCDANDITYYIGYGSLLGAVRHKGFIPWDDDIDIIMPRPDYEKFEQYCLDNDTDFQLASNATCGKSYFKFSPRVTDTGTVLEEPNSKVGRCCAGLFIDIFIIEGLGHTYKEAVRNFKKKRFSRELVVSANWEHFEKSKGGFFRNCVRFLFFIMSRFVDPDRLFKKVDKYYKQFPFDEMEYAGNLGSPYRVKDIFPTKIFKEKARYEFEQRLYPSLRDYDAYLSQLYGDYMTPPPEGKRESPHSFRVFVKEEKDN